MIESVDPRIERTRAVVMRTAIDIVAERGFRGATIDAIAQRSGVARSTIYRHWSQKEDLLLEAMASLVDEVAVVTGGGVRDDLVALARPLSDLLAAEPMGSVVASIILESRRDQALDGLRQKLIERRGLAARGVITVAVERGELDPSVDPEALATELAAPIFFRSLVLRAPVDQAWVEGHVDRVLGIHG